MDVRSGLTVLGACLLTGEASFARQELFKLTASDAGLRNYFGYSAAAAGGRALVGTYRYDASVADPGSAYLFDLATGEELQRWTSSEAAAYDYFGWSVAVSGERALVGAIGAEGAVPISGAAYVFDVTTGQELLELSASDGWAGQSFGASVAVHGDRAVVGARFDFTLGTHAGAAYVFDAGTGQQLFKLLASDGSENARFGESVAISGGRAIVGARYDDEQALASGAAYVFDVNTGQQLFKLTGSGSGFGSIFGQSVALSGDRAVVGASFDPAAGFGAGTAYVFDVSTGQELQKLSPSDGSSGDEFGYSVALSGERAVIGAHGVSPPGQPHVGAAYLFDVTTGAELAKWTASDGDPIDELGFSVAISGGRAVVGARGDDDGGPEAGAAYIFAGDGPGTAYCTAAPNSTGAGATLSAAGSPSVSDGSLTLHASQAPPGQPAIFYAGAAPASLPFGDGFRCVTGSTFRLHPTVSESGGAFEKAIDFGTHGAALGALSTAHFQCWYRDPAAGGAGFNLSDGLALRFVP